MLKHNVLTKTIIPKLNLNEFLENSRIFVQEYSCPLCEGILNECVIDKCGHSFCKECIEKHLSISNLCPYSNTEIVDPNKKLLENLSINRAVNSAIEKQLVYCKNKFLNCEWEGKLADRKFHLTHDCEKEIIQCEYSSDCKDKILKEDLAKHLQDCPYRTVLCHHCKEYSSFNTIDQHYKKCPNYPVICPKNCDKTIPNSSIYHHLEFECDNSTASCPFKVLGCNYIDLRKELKIHLNENLEDHLKLISCRIKSMENDIQDLTTLNQNLQKENQQLKKKIDDSNNLIVMNHMEMLKSYEKVYRTVQNLKQISVIPSANIKPEFSKLSNNQIFDISEEESYLTIKKYQDNLGWYGISSQLIETQTPYNKVIINIKIIQTFNSCIFFGITFSSQNSPLQKGFYTQTDDENVSYMLYLHNCSLYTRGVSINSGTDEPTRCEDIITLMLDLDHNTMVFKKNGITVIPTKQIDQNFQNLRIALDFSDLDDKIMFV